MSQPPPPDHRERNREAFTQQAVAYATSPIITNQDRLRRLVDAVAPTASDRVLEVACGPGHVSLAIAPHAGAVAGIDLTEKPIAIARENAAARGIANARFQVADAYQLPFVDGCFDAAVSRYAFHHLEYPLRALREMARCTRRGGRVVLEDMFASENPMRAQRHDRVEILRDPSHRRALPLGEMAGLFALAGLEVEHVSTATIPQDVAHWLSEMGTPEEAARAARTAMEADAAEDVSGLRPFVDEAGQLKFTHRTVIVVGRKL